MYGVVILFRLVAILLLILSAVFFGWAGVAWYVAGYVICLFQVGAANASDGVRL